MLSSLKRIVVCMLALLMLFLCSCGEGEVSSPWTGRKKETFTPSGDKVKSSIFGRNVSYEKITPNENCVLPIDSKDITDMLQIGTTLYFLTDGAIYTLDIESGQSGKLFDTDAEVFAEYGDRLYTYAPESGKLCVYSPDGSPVSENIIPVEGEDLLVKRLFITDDYYDFMCRAISKKGYYIDRHFLIDRETLEKVKDVDGKDSFSSPHIRVYGSYKGNSLLKVEDAPLDSRFVRIYEINLDTGESTSLSEIDVSPWQSEVNLAYNSKTDTALILAAPSASTSNPIDFTPYIMECSLSDPDNIIQKKFKLEKPVCEKLFLGVYENAVSAVFSTDNEYRCFDYLNPPESITLACSTKERYEEIIDSFETETGILVRTVNYGNDIDRLDIKLMAGDTDFDLFEPIYLHQHKYLFSGMFEDLSQYDGLKKRLDGDLAAGYVSNLNGEYVGIPTGIGCSTTRESYPEDGPVDYSTNISRIIYLAQNLDLATGEFKDEDGSELYKLLKFLYDYPEGNEDKMPFGNEIFQLSCGFIMMNPNGGNKENSVKFLEYMFDVLNGDIEGVVPVDRQYINIDSTEDVYVDWRSFAISYVKPIFDATNSISKCDGKSSTIKKIAREAVEGVKMRLAG